MNISEFDYHLPEKLIAQHSVEPRDHSRLMIVGHESGKIEHEKFFNIVDYLQKGDVLVLNKTKVFKARLTARKIPSSIITEVFLIKPVGGVWEAMLKPARRIKQGTVLHFEDGLTAEVVQKGDEVDAVSLLKFDRSDDEVFEYCQRFGGIPVPPYVEGQPDALENYQTIYAQDRGSVAAPTAGFHFTDELIEKIEAMGVQIEYVTLHVGLGTFQPVKVEELEEHKMHSEFVVIESGAARRINEAKQESRRVIAVGTTSTRALEGVAANFNPPPFQGGAGGGYQIILPPQGFTGEVDIFIKPGFKFKVIDGLITNFHLPKSTLLVMISALAGQGLIKKAYSEAIAHEYRFYSFGDAMFII